MNYRFATTTVSTPLDACFSRTTSGSERWPNSANAKANGFSGLAYGHAEGASIGDM